MDRREIRRDRRMRHTRNQILAHHFHSAFPLVQRTEELILQSPLSSPHLCVPSHLLKFMLVERGEERAGGEGEGEREGEFQGRESKALNG